MSVPTQETLQFADVYIDESSHTGHRYLVLGAIAIDTKDVAQACALIKRARLPELPAGKMKWTKVSTAKLPAYQRAVDAFFDLRPKIEAHFHSLIVDTTKQKHEIYNLGSREIGFNKEIYQLAMKVGRIYNMLFHIYPDRRSTDQPLETLRLMLNRGIKKSGDKRDWPFRRVQFREPEDCELLQLADVFAGAIAFRLNGHHRKTGASLPKVALSFRILAKAGIADVTRDTSRVGPFTIWHRKLR